MHLSPPTKTVPSLVRIRSPSDPRTVFNYNNDNEEKDDDDEVHLMSTYFVPGVGWHFMRILSLDPNNGLRRRYSRVFGFPRRACNGDFVHMMS